MGAGKGIVSDKAISDKSVTILERLPVTTPPVETEQASKGPLSLIKDMSEKTKLRLKLLISIVLFASLFLFGKVDLSECWKAALHANKFYLASAAAVFLSSVILNAHRWQLLAAAVGLEKPLLKLVQYCYVGLFFNLFLPSTVGGDFSRCYYLSKGTGKYGRALYSVLADRALGIAVLFLMGTMGLAFGPGSALPWQLKWPIFGGTFLVFCILPLAPMLSNMVLGPRSFISRQFNQSAASVYWKDSKLMTVSFFWSVVLQLIMVGVHLAIGLSLGLTNVPLWYYFVFYPCVAVLGFVTPSFNGIGIREWAYTYFLTTMGVDRSLALTYAIMWLGLTTMISLTGGLVYVAGHFKAPPKEELEEMQHQPLEAGLS